MARKKLSEWPRAHCRYHPARQQGFRFETLAEARRRDSKRSRTLAAYPDIAAARGGVIASLAKPDRHRRKMLSARYKRARRVRFGGQLLWLISRRNAVVKFSTLIPAGWLIPASELAELDPAKLLQQLRAVLNRAGIGGASGWAVMVLDMEYIEHLESWSCHVHGLSTGGKTRLIRAIRDRPKFRACADHADIGRRPVQMKSITAGTIARVVNYLLKAFFGKRVFIEEDGKMVRTRRRVALPPRREAELLAWLSNWEVDDFVLTFGLYFGRNGLRLSKRRVHLTYQ